MRFWDILKFSELNFLKILGDLQKDNMEIQNPLRGFMEFTRAPRNPPKQGGGRRLVLLREICDYD